VSKAWRARFASLFGVLGRRCLRLSAVAALVLTCLGAAAGLVRLLPWLLAPEVPLEVALPFARALGAATTELAALLALPIGFALAAALFNERGETRALAALGVGPARLALSTAAHAALSSALAFAVALAWGTKADVPGRFAAQLVREGRASCARAHGPKSASVPLVGVTWLCFPDAAPRVTGPLPGSGVRAWFSAADLVPSDDLREVVLTDLRVVTRAAPDEKRLNLHVDRGVIRGLAAWGRSAKLSPWARGSLTSLTAMLLSLFGAFTVLGTDVRRRWLALAVGGVPAVAAAFALQRIDASSAGPLAYAWVPSVALTVSALVRLLMRRVARAPAG
jgi:hypothetical protein